MDCVNCGAPLSGGSHVCVFCETLNDVDLRAIERAAEVGPATDQICPRCGERLVSVAVRFEDRMFIERCDKCLGIFFDPGELETVLDDSVRHVSGVDRDRLRQIAERADARDFESVAYVKCPVCGQLMNRKSYGAGAGVIVDRCKRHGVWLDGGELGVILRWTKAGGKLHDDMKRAEGAKAEQRAKNRHTRWTTPFSLDQDNASAASPLAFPGLLRAVTHLLT